MIRHQKAWEAYFWLLVFFLILGVAPDIRDVMENPTLANVGENVFGYMVGVVGLVGLYGFVRQKPIGKVGYWKLFFFVHVLYVPASVTFGLITEPETKSFPFVWAFMLFLGVFVIFEALILYANFTYAFRSSHIWKKRALTRRSTARTQQRRAPVS